MAVERVEPGAPVATPSGSFGAPPDQYFQAEPEPVAAPTLDPVAQAAAPAVEAAPVAPAPVDQAAAAAAVAGDPAAESWLAQQAPEVQNEVTRLRREAANYRTRAQQAEGLFSGWQDDDRSVLEEAIRLSATDPDAAASLWQQIADIFGGDGQDPTGQAPAAYQPVPAGLTEDRLQQILDQRDQRSRAEAAADAQQTKIVEQATALGYQENTPDYTQLLWHAVNETGGDLDAAHQKVQASRQAVIDQYLQSQANAAQQLPTPVPTGAGPMPQGQPITNLKQSRSGAEAYLDQLLGPRPQQ